MDRKEASKQAAGSHYFNDYYEKSLAAWRLSVRQKCADALRKFR